MTEKEAREAGYDVVIGRAPYAICGKASTAGEPDGLVKIVADRKTGLILGGHVCGQVAAEIVHELALAMHAKVTYQSLAEMMHAYPTYSECIRVAALDVGNGN
jgi:dihydrolipoamide dehydrogenase